MNKKEELYEQIHQLKQEIKHYEKEKEQVKKITGQIGGKESDNTPKLMNIFFLTMVVLEILAALFLPSEYSFIVIELAIALISLKLAHLLHQLRKINHFELWIMSSLEFRFNQMSNEMKIIGKGIDKLKEKSEHK